MFRTPHKEQIVITNSQGDRIVNTSIGKLREASLEVLQDEVEDMKEMHGYLSEFIAESEVMFMDTYMFESLEATRNGLRMYADGTIKSQIDKINKEMEEFAKITPGFQCARESEEEKQKNDELFELMVSGAVLYVKNVETCTKLGRFIRIIDGIIGEKELLQREPAISKKM